MTAAADVAETPAAVIPEGLAAAVVIAVTELHEQFAGHPIAVDLDGAGGVFVVIDNVEPGAPYAETSTWLGFQITAVYPDADVYPHFIGRIRRSDAQPHAEGFADTEWQGRQALQLSRRSNHWNRGTDTAALKAMKVLAWLASR